MSSKFDEGRERSARAAKVRRVRLFVLGAIAGASVLAATAWIAWSLAPKPAWTPITSPPPKHMVVVVMRQDGEWRTGYLDDRGQMLSPDNGAIIHGAWWWMAIPPKP